MTVLVLVSDLTWPLELLYLFRCLMNSDLEVFPTAISDALPLASLKQWSQRHNKSSCSMFEQSQWVAVHVTHQRTWCWEPDREEWLDSDKGWTWCWCWDTRPGCLSRTPPPLQLLKGKKEGVDKILFNPNHSFEFEWTCCKETLAWLRLRVLILVLLSVKTIGNVLIKINTNIRQG